MIVGSQILLKKKSPNKINEISPEKQNQIFLEKQTKFLNSIQIEQKEIERKQNLNEKMEKLILNNQINNTNNFNKINLTPKAHRGVTFQESEVAGSIQKDFSPDESEVRKIVKNYHYDNDSNNNNNNNNNNSNDDNNDKNNNTFYTNYHDNNGNNDCNNKNHDNNDYNDSDSRNNTSDNNNCNHCNNDNKYYNYNNNNNNNENNNYYNNDNNNDDNKSDDNGSSPLTPITKSKSIPLIFDINDYKKYITSDDMKLNKYQHEDDNRNESKKENEYKHDKDMKYKERNNSDNPETDYNEKHNNINIHKNIVGANEKNIISKKNVNKKIEVESREEINKLLPDKKQEKSAEKKNDMKNSYFEKRLNINEMKNIAEELSLSPNRKNNPETKDTKMNDWSQRQVEDNDEVRTHKTSIIDTYGQTYTNNGNSDEIEKEKFVIGSATNDDSDSNSAIKKTHFLEKYENFDEDSLISNEYLLLLEKNKIREKKWNFDKNENKNENRNEDKNKNKNGYEKEQEKEEGKEIAKNDKSKFSIPFSPEIISSEKKKKSLEKISENLLDTTMSLERRNILKNLLERCVRSLFIWKILCLLFSSN